MCTCMMILCEEGVLNIGGGAILDLCYSSFAKHLYVRTW